MSLFDKLLDKATNINAIVDLKVNVGFIKCYIYIYIYIYIYVCVRVCVCVPIYINIHQSLRIYTNIYQKSSTTLNNYHNFICIIYILRIIRIYFKTCIIRPSHSLLHFKSELSLIKTLT